MQNWYYAPCSRLLFSAQLSRGCIQVSQVINPRGCSVPFYRPRIHCVFLPFSPTQSIYQTTSSWTVYLLPVYTVACIALAQPPRSWGATLPKGDREETRLKSFSSLIQSLVGSVYLYIVPLAPNYINMPCYAGRYCQPDATLKTESIRKMNLARVHIRTRRSIAHLRLSRFLSHFSLPAAQYFFRALYIPIKFLF